MGRRSRTTDGASNGASIHAGGGAGASRCRHRRPSAAARGYDKAWRRLRLAHLAEHPVCEECKAQGLVVVATEVDHKKKFRRADGTINDALRLDPDNLRSLCKPCHSRKTNQQDIASRRASPIRGSAEDGSPLDPDHPWSTS